MIKRRFLWSLMAVMSVVAAVPVLSSCGDDDDEFVDLFRSENIESIDISMSPWYFPTTGTLSATPIVRLKSGTPSIKEVEYYIDGKSVYKSGTSPFGISYPLAGVSVGDHTLKAVIKYGGGRTLTLDGCLFAVYDEEKDFEGCRVRPFSRTVENGQTLYCDYACIPRKINETNETTIKYYHYIKLIWDGVEIQENTSPVCTFSFPVTNQSTGKHKLSVQAEFSLEVQFPGVIGGWTREAINFDYDITVSK